MLPFISPFYFMLFSIHIFAVLKRMLNQFKRQSGKVGLLVNLHFLAGGPSILTYSEAKEDNQQS